MTILTDDNFESTIATGVTVVDFYADWCQPCKALGPIFAKLGEAYEGRALYAKVDVEACPITTEKYKISALPTIIVFVGGQEVERNNGMLSPSKLQALTEKHY